MTPPHGASPVILAPEAVFQDPPGRLEVGLAVATKGGHVQRVGPLDDLRAQLPSDTSIVDLSGHVLLPGLINTHVHLSFTGTGDPRRVYLQERPETRLVRATRNAYTMLHSGVTTARDCGSDWTMLALHDVASAGLCRAPNLLLSGPPITPTGGHLHHMGGEADGAEEVRKLSRLLHKRGATSIKMMATGGQMTPGTLPEHAAFTLEEMQAAVTSAAELGLPTVAHVLGTEGIRRAARARFDSLEHCAFFHREEHGWLERVFDDEVAEEVLRCGASAMIGVAASYHVRDTARNSGSPNEHDAFQLAQEERMFDIARRFFELGVPIVCGTDAGVKETPFDETWLELALLVDRAGMSPLDALRAATTNAARALKIDTHVGRVAPGFRADLIATTKDPLEHPGALRDMPWVMRAGQIVKEGGEAR